MGSPRFVLDMIDWRKILIGLVVALIGALLTWALELLIPALQTSDNYWLLLLAAVLSGVVNALRKFFSNNASPT